MTTAKSDKTETKDTADDSAERRGFGDGTTGEPVGEEDHTVEELQSWVFSEQPVSWAPAAWQPAITAARETRKGFGDAKSVQPLLDSAFPDKGYKAKDVLTDPHPEPKDEDEAEPAPEPPAPEQQVEDARAASYHPTSGGATTKTAPKGSK